MTEKLLPTSLAQDNKLSSGSIICLRGGAHTHTQNLNSLHHVHHGAPTPIPIHHQIYPGSAQIGLIPFIL